MPVALVQQMREELGFEVVVTAYGLTETSSTITLDRPDAEAERRFEGIVIDSRASMKHQRQAYPFVQPGEQVEPGQQPEAPQRAGQGQLRLELSPGQGSRAMGQVILPPALQLRRARGHRRR